jgi:hypothetical protein
VLDAVPPRFHGDITLAELTAARDSGNEVVHDRDMFFAGVHIDNRWLTVDLPAADTVPALDRAEVARILDLNLRHFGERPAEGSYTGLAGMRAFCDDIVKRLTAGEDIRDELFVAAGTVLACTAVHADWLAEAARTAGLPGLTERAREVERLAHHWSAVRIMAALTSTGLSASRLARRFDTLLKDQERALLALDRERAEL